MIMTPCNLRVAVLSESKDGSKYNPFSLVEAKIRSWRKGIRIWQGCSFPQLEPCLHWDFLNQRLPALIFVYLLNKMLHTFSYTAPLKRFYTPPTQNSRIVSELVLHLGIIQKALLFVQLLHHRCPLACIKIEWSINVCSSSPYHLWF